MSNFINIVLYSLGGDMSYSTKIKNRFSTELDQFRTMKFEADSKPDCICGNCHKIESIPVYKDICIIYSKGTRNLASIQMRLPQSAKHLLYLNPNIKIQGFCLQDSRVNHIKNKCVILTKFAAINITNYDLNILISNGNFIFVDPIDAEIDLSRFQNIHAFIASSFKQYEYFKNETNNLVELVYHPSDLRLKKIKSQNQSYCLGYFGSLSRIPKELASIDLLTVINTPLSFEPKLNLPRYSSSLSIYSAHLAVGTIMPKLVFKPFTKGLVATSVGSVTLISRDDSEAITMLGSNYPYVAADSKKKSVLEAAIYMKETFLKSEWQTAQILHKKLLPLSCDLSVALSWAKIFSKVT